MKQHKVLIDKAIALGAKVIDVSQTMQRHAAILEYKGISELILEGIPTSWITARSQFYCDNKQLTKLAYEALGVPHPKSVIFNTPEDLLPSSLREGTAYVCKPLDSAHGLGVKMDIQDMAEIKRYYQKYKYLDTVFMLEEQIEGKDLRLHIIEGKIVAACIRVPAYVLGNGTDRLDTLIKKRQAVIETQNPDNHLEIDEATLKILKDQVIALSDIPRKNQKVQLKQVSNIAQGGIPVDVTDEVAPIYHTWASAFSKYLGTGYMGLDFITTDHQTYKNGQTWILEINTYADWLHHTFSDGRTHDIGGMILRALFGE